MARLGTMEFAAYFDQLVPVLRHLKANPKVKLTYKEVATYVGMLDADDGKWTAPMVQRVPELLNLAAAIDRYCDAEFGDVWKQIVNQGTGESGPGVHKESLRIIRPD